MKNPLFMIISSFLPLILLNLFAERNSSMAQPPTGQPQMVESQRGPSLTQELEAYSLPSGPIAENDMPRIKTVIQEVLVKISEYLKNPPRTSARSFMFQSEPEDQSEGSNVETIKSGILAFQDWLRKQECVDQASATYDIEATDKYSDHIFVTYPGQLPFDIVFNMEGDMKKQHRLLIFVSTVDLLSFASLIENRTLSGVPVPENWPSSYMEKSP